MGSLSRASLAMVFGNISEWGPKAESFLRQLPKAGGDIDLATCLALEAAWDVIAIAEHRLSRLDLQKLATLLQDIGWRLVGVPAKQGPAGGTSGGCLVLVRAFLSIWPMAKAPCVAAELSPALGHGLDWVAVQANLRGSDLVLIVVYFADTIGMTGINLEKAEQIANFVRGLRGPVALVGDFNHTPAVLQASGFLQRLGPPGSFSIAEPSNVNFTCSAGEGRMYDYYVLNSQASSLFSVPVAVDGWPFKVHRAVAATVSCTPLAVQVNKLVVPRQFFKATSDDKDFEVSALSWKQAQELSQHTVGSNWDESIKHACCGPLGGKLVDEDSCRTLTYAFENFGSTLSTWLCHKHGISKDFHYLYSGAFQAPRFVQRRLCARGQDVAAHPLVKDHLQWASIAASFAMVRTLLHNNESDAAALPVEQRSLPAQLRAWVWALLDSEQDDHERSVLLVLVLQVAGSPFSSVAEVELAIQGVTKRVLAAEARVKAHYKGRARKWAAEAIQGHATDAFNRIKAGATTSTISTTTTVHPGLAMEARADEWTARWSVEGGVLSDSLDRSLVKLQHLAKEEAAITDPLSVQQVIEADKSLKKTSSLGADWVAAGTFTDLPPAGQQQITDLMNATVSSVQLAVQGLFNLMAVIPKPVGERLVAKMPMHLRVMFKARRWHIAEWESAHSQFWDSAIAGSSALRAALLRSYKLERATALGAAAAAALVDIEKCYDSLDPELLVDCLLELGFPPLSLFLHLMVHWAPRVIQHRGVASRIIAVTRSILAGCTSSGTIAKGYLYKMCEAMHNKLPMVKLSTYVDDLVLWVIGAFTTVAADLAEAVIYLVQLLQNAKLKVADKSMVVGSTFVLAA